MLKKGIILIAVLGAVLAGCGTPQADPVAQRELEQKQKAVETPEDKANHD